MVSVVIPAFNEAERISNVLDSIVRQTIAQDLEVIVVDNNSTDQTSAIAKTYQTQLSLRVVIEQKPGRGAARSAGFKLAVGKIILSTDADTVVPSQWAATMLKSLSDPAVAAVTGTCRIEDCSARTNAIFNWFQPQAMSFYRLVFRHFWLTGSNFGIKKSAYLQAGGFDPSWSDLEDIELSFRVHKVGKIIFNPQTPVTTSGARFQKGLVVGLLGYVKVFVVRFWFNQIPSRR